jgi:hypothetical protein
MIDELFLSTTPVDEPCAQVGQQDYHHRTRLEARAFIGQLLRQFGEPPPGAWYKVRACAHDFGTYHELVVRFDEASEEAVAFAYRLEDELPLHWDDQARQELGLPPLPHNTAPTTQQLN